MGTHPIFESDFDCLTECCVSEKQQSFGVGKIESFHFYKRRMLILSRARKNFRMLQTSQLSENRSQNCIISSKLFLTALEPCQMINLNFWSILSCGKVMKNITELLWMREKKS